MIQRRHLNVKNPYIAHYVGRGLPYFKGKYRQQGHGLGNIFASIARSAIPFLKKTFVPILKKGGKALLKTGGKILKDVIVDEKPLKEAVIHRGKQKLSQILDFNHNELPKNRKRKRPKKSSKRKKGKKSKKDILD